MFKIFQKKTDNKDKEKKIRGADELFSSGEIFEAQDKELDNVFKEIATGHVFNEEIKHREIIRAITILTILMLII